MSTSVSDQRMKGQGNQANGPKDHVSEHEDFDSWRNQPHQGYNAPSMASDPYMPSYYGNTFPYQFGVGVGDGTWSNSGDAMPFLGNYGGQMGHDSYGIDGMFGAGAGSFTGFGQPNPSFGYGFQGNGGDYSTWGGGGGGSASANSNAAGPATNNGGRNKNGGASSASYDDYYGHHRGGPGGNDGYGSRASEDHHLKAVEHGMTGLGIDGGKGDGNSGGNSGSGDKHDGKMGGLGGHLDSNSGSHHVNHGNAPSSSQPKKLTWASVASQPAKPQLTIKKKSSVPPPMVANRAPPSLDIGLWESKNGGAGMNVGPPVPPPPSGLGPGGPIGALNMNKNMAPPQPNRQALYQGVRPPMRGGPQQMMPQGGPLPPTAFPPPPAQPSMPTAPPPQMATPPMLPLAGGAATGVAGNSPLAPHHPVLDELHSKHEYNPKEFDLNAKNARFFVIKSYSEDDIHRSIKYEVWCSTEHGNKRLDSAYREREAKGPVYLFFSVNGSGHFCGMAEMISAVDMGATLSVWAQDKWRGQFGVKWIYVKDVPNSALRHIRLENNENKPVTNSRDTQEVPPEKGRQVLRIIHTYRHATSIFDDFIHYEKRQEEEHQRKVQPPSNHAERGGAGNGSGPERGGGPDRGERGERGERVERGERGGEQRGEREPRGRPSYDYRDNQQRERDGFRGDRDGPHRGGEGRGPPRGDMYRGEGRDMRDRDREREHHDGGMSRDGPGGGRGRGVRGGGRN